MEDKKTIKGNWTDRNEKRNVEGVDGVHYIENAEEGEMRVLKIH